MNAKTLNAAADQARFVAFGTEDALIRSYTAVLKAAGRRSARLFSRSAVRTLTAAGNDRPGWSPPDLSLVVDGAAASEAALRKTSAAKKRTLELVGGTMSKPLGVTFDVNAEAPSALLSNIDKFSDFVSAGLIQPIQDVIANAYSDGLSVKQTADLIRSTVDGISEWQATMLARTDLIALANGAVDISVQQFNAAARSQGKRTFESKRWLTAGDGDVRPAHADAAGQTVPISAAFQVAGESLEYPGDPGGSPGNVINCRCVAVYEESVMALAAAAANARPELAMVALYPNADQANQLAQYGGQEPEQVHLTLVFLGAEDSFDPDTAKRAVEAIARSSPPLEGRIGGLGIFAADTAQGFPQVALVDARGLDVLRARMCERLWNVGIESPSEHGFEPHITLTYDDGPVLPERPEGLLGEPLTFETLSLVIAGERFDYPFGEIETPAEGGDMSTVKTNGGSGGGNASSAAYTLLAAASGSTSLPLSGRTDTWDAGAARKSLQPTDYPKAHFWRDPNGDPKALSSYKLPFARRTGSGLQAVWRGVTAAAARLSQTDMPSGDVAGVKSKIGAYYSKARSTFNDDSIQPPWANQTAAVTITVDGGDEEATESAATTVPWVGVLALEGLMTDDGRYFMPEAFSWRDLPLSLMAQTVTAEGHDGAQLAGRIDRIWRVARPDLGEDVTAIMGEGELTTTFGVQTIAPLVADKTLRGTSADYAVHAIRVLNCQTLEPVDDDDAALMGLMDGSCMYGVADAVIGMATICGFPAFGDAQIAIVACAAGTMTVFNQVPVEAGPVGLTAAAAGLAPLYPPGDWFDDPKLKGPTPITVTDDGRVYGHLALWNSCHVGEPNGRGICVPPPHSRTGYANFHLGDFVTAEGDHISVGKLMLGPHAGITLTRAAAIRHYDDIKNVGAFVRAGEDRHGIWVAGAVRSDLEAERLRDFRANPLSGDWRGHEMIAGIPVPVPGFAVPRPEVYATVSSAGTLEYDTILAAGMFCPDCLEPDVADYQTRLRVLAVMAEDGLAGLAALAAE